MKIAKRIHDEVEEIKRSIRGGTRICGPGLGEGIYYPPDEVDHSIVLVRRDEDDGVYYSIAHSEVNKDVGREIGDGWPKPVIAWFRSKRQNGIYGLYENQSNWLSYDRNGFSLTKRRSNRKLEERAKGIAEFMARETGLPLVVEG